MKVSSVRTAQANFPKPPFVLTLATLLFKVPIKLRRDFESSFESYAISFQTLFMIYFLKI